jgi:AraC-like DNA-binding protein
MRLADLHASALTEPPLWPPLLATRGPGGKSAPHAHHGMHVVLALAGELRLREGRAWRRVAGVVTAPDVPHALDGSDAEVLLVFLDPESDAGVALQSVLGGATRALRDGERDRLVAGGADPLAIMREGGVAWTRHAVAVLGGTAPPSAPRRIHPRVRRLLRQLRALPVGADASLETLAQSVGLSPGRLMHAFTESIGVPLRPYLAWLKLQRAAALVVAGAPLSDAAAAAGFADAAHMSRTFRRMLGMPPSALRVAAS